MRTRTVSWIENKIVKVLSQKRKVTSYLSLSSLVLKNVRSIQEQRNLDIGIANLISKKVITKEKDKDGFTVFKLAA